MVFLLEKKKKKSEVVKDGRFPLVGPMSYIKQKKSQYIKHELSFLVLTVV